VSLCLPKPTQLTTSRRGGVTGAYYRPGIRRAGMPGPFPHITSTYLHTTMRAFVIDHYAHPSKLQLRADAPEPAAASLKSDEVLVDVHSAALNFFDVRPATPGTACGHD
jgi:hypothetical protein